MFDFSWEVTGKIAGATVAILSGAAVAYRYTKKAYKKIHISISPIYRLPSRVMSLEEKHAQLLEGLNYLKENIDIIKSEVITNGAGVSLKRALRHEVETRWTEYELSHKAVWQAGRYNEKDFGCVRATSALINIVGSSPLGMGWMNALHPDDRERVTNAWHFAIENGHNYDQLQRFVHVDGRGKKMKTTYVRAFFRPEFDDHGNFEGGLGVLTELSREEYEQRLRDG